MTLKMLVSRLSESKNEEGVLCLVGFCIEAWRGGGSERGCGSTIVFHAN